MSVIVLGWSEHEHKSPCVVPQTKRSTRCGRRYLAIGPPGGVLHPRIPAIETSNFTPGHGRANASRRAVHTMTGNEPRRRRKSGSSLPRPENQAARKPVSVSRITFSRRPLCEGLCEAQGEKVSTSLAVGTSRATGEGKEGQQVEIHLPGLRAMPSKNGTASYGPTDVFSLTQQEKEPARRPALRERALAPTPLRLTFSRRTEVLG